jgi:ankyrin repeat protein
VKLGAVLCAAALLGGAARGPGGPGPRGRSADVPPSPTVANAAMAGDTATVRRLVASGANVNVAQGDGMTALHWAAERGDVKMANELLKAHASVKAVTREASYTPLHIASKNGNAAVVRALLNAGADVKALTNSGATALHLAAGSGSADAVLALIEKGADVNAKESAHGQTPLVFAAEYNRADAIRVLLKHGADANVYTAEENLGEQSARDQAAQKKRNEVLISYMPQARKDSVAAAAKAEAARLAANPGLAGGRGGGGARGGAAGGMRPVGPFTPEQVQAAIDSGRALAMSAAAAKGPVTEVVDTINGGVAGYAASVGGMGGLTALHHAARQGNVAAVAALLDGGANINEVSLTDHTTPLLIATINGQFDVAMQLIARGADANIESTAGATPLYTTINTQWAPRSRFPQPEAIQNQKAGYLDVMAALLKAHADPNVRIKTHLWYFAFNNCGNANCGLENLEGTTAFWRAAYATDVDAMKLLIQTSRPRKPLSRAVAGGVDAAARQVGVAAPVALMRPRVALHLRRRRSTDARMFPPVLTAARPPRLAAVADAV